MEKKKPKTMLSLEEKRPGSDQWTPVQGVPLFFRESHAKPYRKCNYNPTRLVFVKHHGTIETDMPSISFGRIR